MSKIPYEKTASAYLALTGRLPRLGEDPQPWTYHGWLLVMVQLLHGDPRAREKHDFPDRWGYYARVLEADERGELPDEPIPRADFFSADAGVLGQTEKWLSLVERERGHWSGYESFVRWLAWGLGQSDEPSDLPAKLQEELYREVDLGLWLKHPSDYLGEVAARRYGGGPNAFFPTPHSVCEVMCAMTFGRDVDWRLKTVSEPALGTGRLLLHASNHSLRLCGQDKDGLMALAALCNFAVYAPWATRGLPFTALREREAEVRAAHPDIVF